MNGEQKILIGGVIVLSVGLTKTIQQNKQFTPVLIGGLTFIVLLALLATINPGAQDLAGNFALFVAATSVFVDLPGILNTIQNTPLATQTKIASKSNNPQ